MTTVQGADGRRYEVQSQLYGTRNLIHRLFWGGIFLASTDQRGANGESSSSLETTIARADERATKLGIEVDNG